MKQLLPLYLLLLCIACNNPRTIERGFYYWKQRYQLDSATNNTLKTLNIHHLYVKMFDVALDPTQRTAVPVARLDQKDSFPKNIQITPTVFITNNIWPKVNSDTLARQIAGLLAQICTSNVNEIQMDCDWTRSSKDAYFAFLQALKKQPFLQGKKLSATIRLHQIKFLAGSGTPPVDKGLLMCYNMGNLRKYGDHNSILNMQDLKAYTDRDQISKYPLPLDIALPLFSWSVLFRQQQYTGLLSNLDEHDYQLFEQTGEYLYRVRKDTLLKGYSLRAGDELRHETCPPELLHRTAKYLAKQRQAYNPVVIFFHLDAHNLSQYALTELETTYHLLR